MGPDQIQGRCYRITGLVQGVGFRPKVWQLAQTCNLTGHVRNDAAGIEIEAFGSAEALTRLETLIRKEAPPLSRIDSVVAQDIANAIPPTAFQILESEGGEVSTGIIADAATCPACLAEIFDKGNRRYGYAFTNCTHCGPRLSIVSGIPYDRANTSMLAFPMCDDCRSEYDDPADRRFHAQPNACPACGPSLWFEGGEGVISKTDALQMAADWLAAGKIIAVKGLGGFHLACDATNEDAVARLRMRKKRPAKPFAVMVRNVETAKACAFVNETEASLLAASAAPIVLLGTHGNAVLAPSIASGQDRIGLMLPYTPLHTLLLNMLDVPLVMTSGNCSSEPQATSNDEAKERLVGIADGWLMHDRDIINRVDDSVVRLDEPAVQIIRRARGFAPEPLPLHASFKQAKRILAMGGELKSTFCMLSHGQVTLSQHIGDLEDAATYADYRRNLDLYRKLFGFTPEIIAVDAHPDYLSTQHGRELADRLNVPIVPVQHHHAHLAACLADNGLPPETMALGIVLDGLGLGQDGTIWGAELLLGNCRAFTRLAHFQPVAMPGGAAASREPWRNLAAHLHAAFGNEWSDAVKRYGLIPNVDAAKLRVTEQMITRKVNAPLASSAGRFFDAVAAALNLCTDRQDYEGQTGMMLEALAQSELENARPYPCERAIHHDHIILSWKPLWEALLEDIAAGQTPGFISARFHNGLVQALVETIAPLAVQTDCKWVALSGGVMNNSILFDGLCRGLSDAGLDVLVHQKTPANDGGLALGQAAIASCKASY